MPDRPPGGPDGPDGPPGAPIEYLVPAYLRDDLDTALAHLGHAPILFTPATRTHLAAYAVVRASALTFAVAAAARAARAARARRDTRPRLRLASDPTPDPPPPEDPVTGNLASTAPNPGDFAGHIADQIASVFDASPQEVARMAESRADAERTHAAALLRRVLVDDQGVPPQAADTVLAALWAAGFTPAIDTGHGVVTAGVLVHRGWLADGEARPHTRLRLQAPWTPDTDDGEVDQ